MTMDATLFILMDMSQVLCPCAAENPDLSFGDLTKKLGEMWKGLSDAEKMPYEVLSHCTLSWCLLLSAAA